MKTVLIGFGLFVSTSVAHANLISNSGFEAGNFNGWNNAGLTCSAVGNSFTATTCVGFDADPGPLSGVFAAYLGTSNGSGMIGQTFGTTADVMYTVNFFLANGSFGGLATPNDFLVQWNGTTLMQLTNAVVQDYTEYTFSALATGSSSTLVFISQQTPSFWILDDVSVTPIPEPSTLVLLSLGLFGLAFTALRNTVQHAHRPL